MRILQVHNRQTGTGGADVVIESERTVLTENRHLVEQCFYATPDVAQRVGTIGLAARSVWNREASTAVVKWVSDFEPDVVHFHTIFPLLSFAPIASLANLDNSRRPAMVVTAHGTRYVCASGDMAIDGAQCDQCVGKVLKWPAIKNRCYHGSASQSALLAASLYLGTHVRSAVDAWMTLTPDGKRLLASDGIDPARIHVKPNWAKDLAEDSRPQRNRNSRPTEFTFVGRTEAFKGLSTLIESWARVRPTTAKLRIVGDGALSEADFGSVENVEWLGWLEHRHLADLLAQTDVLIAPSELAEGDPLTVIEAASMGVPTLTSATPPRLTSNVVAYGAGWTFDTGSVDGLSRRLAQILALESTAHESANARRMYDEIHSVEAVRTQLEAVYRQAILDRQSSRQAEEH